VPLYDYQCQQCKKTTEVRHAVKEPYTEPCPSCGGKLARVFNPAGIVFKGSGFYINDSRKGGSGESSSGSTTSTPAASESSTPKKSDAPAA